MKAYIKYHKNKYHKMTTQDIVKLLYQNHFGPGHFIKDIDTIKNYYNHESNIINVNINNNLYEHIGNNFVRVNLYPYNNYFNKEYLINAFYESSLFDFNNCMFKERFKNILLEIDNDGFLNNYNYDNVHHSLIFNNEYNPHYRVVNTKFLNIEMKTFQLQNYIDSFNEFTIFALEGKCASGKTTISNNLKNITIIDVDEFFLNNDLKTKERLNEIGGNIDYDLYEQCLQKIKPNSTITYTIFDCSTQSYSTKTIDIKEKVLLVGVYSYHQKVRKYIDKLCYLIVNENEQLNRLKQRKMFDRFINEWVPLENKYYNSFDFIGEANILI